MTTKTNEMYEGLEYTPLILGNNKNFGYAGFIQRQSSVISDPLVADLRHAA